MELRPERSFIGDKLIVAIDFSSVFDSNFKIILVVHEDVSNVHLCDGELSLRAFALTSHVEGESFLRTGDVAKSGAGVVIGSSWFECNATGNFGVWPDLSLQRLNIEDVVLEEHQVFIYSLSNALKLSCQSCDGSKI